MTVFRPKFDTTPVQRKQRPSVATTVPSGAAGSVVDVSLIYAPLLNSDGNFVGAFNDTSVSFTSSTFTTEVAQNTLDEDLSNGEYWIDYLNGRLRGKKADTGTTLTFDCYTYETQSQESNAPLTAFGELSIAESTPVTQIDFPYNINERLVKKVITLSFPATPSASFSKFDEFTGGTSNAVVVALNDVDGADTEALFLVKSGTPAGTETFTLVGGATTFVTGAAGTLGSVTQSSGMAVISTGAQADTEAGIVSKKTIKYRPGQGVIARYTALFTTGVAGNVQEAGIGDERNQDGYFFGYNGTAFGINRKSGGTDNWTAQTSWNIDKMDGTGQSGMTLDQTKGNVYQIQYQWLGYGAIIYSIEDEATGQFTPVHRIDFANANTTPSVLNPSFRIRFSSKNTTNNTDIVLKTASAAAFIQGKKEKIGSVNSISNTKTSVGTTQTNILTIKNKYTYASTDNRVRVDVRFVTVATEGNKTVTAKIIKNTTLGGSPSYTDIDTTYSTVSYDVAGTTVTGGTELLDINLAKTDAKDQIIDFISIFLEPGETLTVAGAYNNAGSGDISASLTWEEEI